MSANRYLVSFDARNTFHRFTAVSYKLPLMELMAGAGHAIAEANGISAAGHVRDKLTHLAAYHTTVRGLIEQAAAAKMPKTSLPAASRKKP